MHYEIRYRYSGETMFTADIEADDDTPESIKKGRAALWAIENNVSLQGAYLQGATYGQSQLSEEQKQQLKGE